MSKALRYSTLVGMSVLLTGCSDGFLSPNRSLANGQVAARAVDGVTLNASTGWVDQIYLSWNDNARNENGWEIHRSTSGPQGSFTLLVSLGANVINHMNTGLSPFTQYCYKVRSFKQRGPSKAYEPFSNTACATTFGPPAAPSNLNAVPDAATIRLTWTNNATDAQSLRLERSASQGGPWSTVESLQATQASAIDWVQPFDVLRCYRVVAVNAHGEGVSNVDCTALLRRPENIAAAAIGARIDVTWTDGSNFEDGYEVYRRTDESSFALIVDLPANSASYQDNSVVGETRYWYVVRAKKDGGYSEYSRDAWAVVVTRPPNTPEYMQAVPGGSTAASVTYSEPLTASGFHIDRSPDGVSGWSRVATVQPGQGFWDMERTTEVRVCYRVVAFNALGESAPTPADCTIPPAAPTNVAVVGNEDGSTLVTWTDNSSIEELYLVQTILCYYYYDCYYNQYYIDANSTSFTIPPSYDGYTFEYLDGVFAYYDGGYSDIGVMAGAASIANLTMGKGVMPRKKGDPAPRASAAARKLRVTDKFLGGKVPRR